MDLTRNTSSPHSWPAEWERQEATWIAWPHNVTTWPGHFDSIPRFFERFANELAGFQPVRVLVNPKNPNGAAERLAGRANITLHEIETNDCWIRDFGPTFVKTRAHGELVGIDWRYNAWGGKYLPYDADAAAAERVCWLAGTMRSRSPMHCEGGALETDGAGTLITTNSCLLAPNRNPGWTRTMLEAELSRQLGVSQIIWLGGKSLEGDDTDGHVDQVARFIAPGIVVVASTDTGDQNHAGLRDNARVLREAVDARGKRLEVHELPLPPPRCHQGARIPESYCNFVFVNGALFVPTFRNPETDRVAVELLAGLLPDRQIIPLDASDLVLGLGALHCISQQQPAGQ